MVELRLQVRDCELRLEVTGSLDEWSIDQFREALATLVGPTEDPRLRRVVDLAGVDFLPSVAIGALTAASRTARRHGTALEIEAPGGTVAGRILRFAGIDGVG